MVSVHALGYASARLELLRYFRHAPPNHRLVQCTSEQMLKSCNLNLFACQFEWRPFPYPISRFSFPVPSFSTGWDLGTRLPACRGWCKSWSLDWNDGLDYGLKIGLGFWLKMRWMTTVSNYFPSSASEAVIKPVSGHAVSLWLFYTQCELNQKTIILLFEHILVNSAVWLFYCEDHH